MTIFIFYSAAANLKKVSLELGGKSPLIIFSDCELDRAVKMVMLLWSKIYSKTLWYILTVLQYSSWLAKKNIRDPLHEKPWDLLENRLRCFFMPAQFNCPCGPKKYYKKYTLEITTKRRIELPIAIYFTISHNNSPYLPAIFCSKFINKMLHWWYPFT